VALGARRIFSLEVPDYKLHHTTSPAVIKMKEQVRPYKVEVL
jgi:hypothetical protein